MAAHEPFESEYRIVWPDGSVHWLAARGLFQYDDQSAPIRLLGILMEITERKRTEESLLRRNAVFKGINRIFEEATLAGTEEEFCKVCMDVAMEITGSKLGFIDEIGTDGQLNILYISDPGWEACRISNPIGHRPPSCGLKIQGIYGCVIRDGKSLFTNDPASHSDRIGLPEGHPPLMAFLGVPLMRRGEVAGLIAVGNREGGYRVEDQELLESLASTIVEALDRKRAEAALRASEERLTAALGVAALSVWEYRPDTGRIKYDQRSGEIFGTGDLRAMTLEEFLAFVHEQDRQRVAADVRDAFDPAGNGLYDTEYRIIRRDGAQRWLAARGHTIFAGDGPTRQLVRCVGTVMDITARKQAQEELRKSRDELEIRVAERTAELAASNRALTEYVIKLDKLNKELQDFSFAAAHDLQEPLRKIQTFCDLARMRCASAVDGAGQDYLDRAIKSASRMRQLLHDLLQYSRVTSQGEVYKEVDLDKIAREATDLFDENLQKSGGKVEIQNLPCIFADESQMQRLFQNLIGNAVKYRGDKPPQIKLYSTIRDTACEIFVEDNGIGFDQAYVEKIFVPFQRLHGRNEYEGTGMGLAICRKITERHGGSITAKGEPGKGSTFIIRLPLNQDRQDEI